MIQQVNFTYSPFGKAFEKQIKTIEDWRKKQIKAIQNQRQVKTIKKYAYDDEKSPFISEAKELFNELVDKGLTDAETDAENDQIDFKSSLGKIKKETTKKDQRSKKTQYTILTCFTKQETRLLNFLMIIPQWYLKQKIKQRIKQVAKDLKY